MQRLSDQPHIVKCYEYNPKPVSARSRPHKTLLVMELMEVCSAAQHGVRVFYYSFRKTCGECAGR